MPSANVNRTPLTPLQEHARRWGKGCGSDYCKTATRVCLVRASRIPCQVFFVGEAPGASEDVIGQPFTGPAGMLLDQIIDRALGGRYSWAMSNLVGCLPLEAGEKGEPCDEAVRKCSRRLRELLLIADGRGDLPLEKTIAYLTGTLRLIVCVGKLSETWLRPGYKDSVELHRRVPQCAIVHPAAILRSPEAARAVAVQRAIVTIQSALEAKPAPPPPARTAADAVSDAGHRWPGEDDIPF